MSEDEDSSGSSNDYTVTAFSVFKIGSLQLLTEAFSIRDRSGRISFLRNNIKEIQKALKKIFEQKFKDNLTDEPNTNKEFKSQIAFEIFDNIERSSIDVGPQNRYINFLFDDSASRILITFGITLNSDGTFNVDLRYRGDFGDSHSMNDESTDVSSSEDEDNSAVNMTYSERQAQALEVLGLNPRQGRRFTEKEIRKAHRKLSRIHHPDKGGSNERMAQINDALDVLLPKYSRKKCLKF
jgi:hypothetical protein